MPKITQKMVQGVLDRQAQVDAAMAHAVRRPFTPRESKKIYIARCAAEHIFLNTARSAVITIRLENLRNPNGIEVRFWPAARTWKANRFVNRSWMDSQVALHRAAGDRMTYDEITTGLRHHIERAVQVVGGSGGRRRCVYCLRESFPGQPEHYRKGVKVDSKSNVVEANEHCLVTLMEAVLETL